MFTKEINFIERVLVGDHFEMKPATKIATFKDLDRNDRSQINLQFNIVSLFPKRNEDGSESNAAINIVPSALASLAIDTISTLLVPNDAFTENDKKEFLADNIAILNFALWFLGEHISPFVAQLSIS